MQIAESLNRKEYISYPRTITNLFDKSFYAKTIIE